MEEINYYTNVGAACMNWETYYMIYDKVDEKFIQKPFYEINSNWDVILNRIKQYCDIPYVLLPFFLWRELSLKYPNIIFKLIDTYQINNQCCCPPYGIPTTIIKNEKTKKFIVISACDQNIFIGNGKIPKNHPSYVSGYDSWDLQNCVDFFPIQGVHENTITYKTNDNMTWLPSNNEGKKYSPGFPVASYSLRGMEHIEKIYKNTDKIIPEKLFADFKVGGTWFRDYLKNDSRFDITHNLNIDIILFIEKFSKYSIIMDVNAVAEVSSRTFEGLGLGCAVIRPELNIQYHNKLIPNYHYAKVDCEDLSDFPKLADAYLNKFQELKNNSELINFYSKNGRKWYEENCKIKSWLKGFSDELIDLEKLN